MDPKRLGFLRDRLVTEFNDPQVLQDWVATHVSDENVHNILTGATLAQLTFALLTWALARSRLDEILQKLADDPPNASRTLPNIIYVWSGGTIQAAVARRNGIPPIAPSKDWFVTRRPFANRSKLRDLLEGLDTAGPGPDSVLVIDGDRFSGKSHGIRMAIQCAPQDRFTAIDIADYDTTVMNAADLAHAIDGFKSADFPPFDPTKEDDAVGRLTGWVTAKLTNSRRWLIIDHCSRANLSRPAGALLTKLAGTIERGALPGVRLIVADVDRTKLPGALPWGSGYDKAELPDRNAVTSWCETLGVHIGKPPLTPDQITDYLDTVFGGITPGAAPDQYASLVEAGLAKVFSRIQAL